MASERSKRRDFLSLSFITKLRQSSLKPILEKLRLTFTSNCKRQIEVENFSEFIENRQLKSVQNNNFLNTGVRLLFFSRIRSNKQLTTIMGKTWSRVTNSRLPFGVNVNLNLSIILFQSIMVNLQRNASIIGS